MKETILLYNLNNAGIRSNIKFISIKLGIHIKTVEPSEYKMPLGFLAFGTKEQQAQYLTDDGTPAFDESMLVFAGFTNRKLDQFLQLMKKHRVPRIPLKAIMTEHNATWDSVMLHDELAKEDAYMTQQAKGTAQAEETSEA